MSRVVDHHSLDVHWRRFTILAALAIVLAAGIGSDMPAAANHESANCAVGGNLDDGGTGSVGCSFGGIAGASLAGTIDVSDPAMTVAAGYGGPYGYSAVGVAGVIDVADPGVVLAGGAGGSFPYPAETFAGSYP